MKPASLDSLIEFAGYLAENVGEAPGRMDELADALAHLPPSGGEILTRPMFERGTLWTLPALFERVGPDDPPVEQSIRVTEDMWFRGMVGMARLLVTADNVDTLDGSAETAQVLSTICPNLRQLFDVQWSLNGKQGFVSQGNSESFARGDDVLGDGGFSVPLDWQLQQDDVIDVRIRSRVRRFSSDADPPTLRALYVVFWGEGLTKGPSVQ